MRAALASAAGRATTRRRPRPPSSRYDSPSHHPSLPPSSHPSLPHHTHTQPQRQLSRRPAFRTPAPPPAPLPPLALAPTIYTLPGLFDEPPAPPSLDPSLPSPPPSAPASPASSLLPSPSLRGKAKVLFTGPPLYHSPASLGYALPPVQSNKHTEVAFLGRSNVGKSSLVAALLGGGNKGGGERGGGGSGGGGSGGGGGGKAQGQLVRTSKTPGCTQTLNLYSLQVCLDPSIPPFPLSLLPSLLDKLVGRWVEALHHPSLPPSLPALPPSLPPSSPSLKGPLLLLPR